MTRLSVVCLLIMLLSAPAHAVVALSGTRLVFDGRFREATLELSNPEAAQVLVQAWLTPGTYADTPSTGALADLPFVVTPHLATLSGQGRQRLRVLYEGVGMPLDRESLLHLYVLQVPRKHAARQQLSIAVRQRINVFYRPAHLQGDPADAAQALIWQRQADNPTRLVVRNPTPFHVSLHEVTMAELPVLDHLLIEPFSRHVLALPEGLNAWEASQALHFKALTDYGGQRDYCARSPFSQPFSARLRAADAHPSIGKC